MPQRYLSSPCPPGLTFITVRAPPLGSVSDGIKCSGSPFKGRTGQSGWMETWKAWEPVDQRESLETRGRTTNQGPIAGWRRAVQLFEFSCVCRCNTSYGRSALLFFYYFYLTFFSGLLCASQQPTKQPTRLDLTQVAVTCRWFASHSQRQPYRGRMVAVSPVAWEGLLFRYYFYRDYSVYTVCSRDCASCVHHREGETTERRAYSSYILYLAHQ